MRPDDVSDSGRGEAPDAGQDPAGDAGGRPVSAEAPRPAASAEARARRLVVATEAQKTERDRLAWTAWGERLSVEAFAAREQRLRGHPWTRASMATWLWTDEAGEVLGSCETFDMPSVHRGRTGRTFAVASVFVEDALRGRGHCTDMMQALVARLAQEDSAQASVLYSDVGTALYRRADYREQLTPLRIFEPEPGDPDAGVDALIREDGIPGLLAPDAGRLLPDAPFLVRPTAPQLDWHLERERAYADLLGRDRPAACGARAGDALLLWFADFKEDRLVGLLRLGDDVAGHAAVLHAARRTARGLGLSEVRLWDGPAEPAWPAGADGGRRVERTGSLPMIAPLTEGGPSAAEWTWIPRALWV